MVEEDRRSFNATTSSSGEQFGIKCDSSRMRRLRGWIRRGYSSVLLGQLASAPCEIWGWGGGGRGGWADTGFIEVPSCMLLVSVSIVWGNQRVANSFKLVRVVSATQNGRMRRLGNSEYFNLGQRVDRWEFVNDQRNNFQFINVLHVCENYCPLINAYKYVSKLPPLDQCIEICQRITPRWSICHIWAFYCPFTNAILLVDQCIICMC